MKRFSLGLAVVLFVPLSLHAQDTATDTIQKKVDQKKKSAYQKLTDKYHDAYSSLVGEFRNAKTDEEKIEIRNRIPKLDEKFLSKFLEAAEADPKSNDGLDCLSWILQRKSSGKEFEAALDFLTKHYATHKNVSLVTTGLMYSTSEKASEFLEAVVENHPDKNVKGQTSIILAGQMKRNAEIKGDLKKYAEAEKAYEKVAAEYGDVRAPRGGTIAKASQVALKEMRGPRALGKIAPEIEAEDLDGKTFKLSEYRGKVVLLDFWANW